MWINIPSKLELSNIAKGRRSLNNVFVTYCHRLIIMISDKWHNDLTWQHKDVTGQQVHKSIKDILKKSFQHIYLLASPLFYVQQKHTHFTRRNLYVFVRPLCRLVRIWKTWWQLDGRYGACLCFGVECENST